MIEVKQHKFLATIQMCCCLICSWNTGDATSEALTNGPYWKFSSEEAKGFLLPASWAPPQNQQNLSKDLAFELRPGVQPSAPLSFRG